MTALEFFVLALAVHRVTHLIVEDQIPFVRRPRMWLVNRNPDSSIAYLVNCFWCSSVWVAAGAVGLAYAFTPAGWHGVPAPFILGAALSSAAVFIETVVEWFDASIIGNGG